MVCLLQDVKITVVSYYVSKNSFLHLLQVIQEHRKGILMFGDSNQILQPQMYRLPYTSESHPSSVTLKTLLQQATFPEIWRECNPARHKYTFYSHPHKSFTIIGHIFIPITSFPILLQSSIKPFPWSVHCAVITTILSLIPKTTETTWCLNETRLGNTFFASTFKFL